MVSEMMTGYLFRAWHNGGGDPRVEGEMTYSYPFLAVFWKNVEDEPLDVKVMHYSGVLDINQKEICQGDVLKLTNGRKVQVIWQKWTAGFDCIAIDAVGDNKGGTPTEWPYHAEIIGNIYENPELLEQKESVLTTGLIV